MSKAAPVLKKFFPKAFDDLNISDLLQGTTIIEGYYERADRKIAYHDHAVYFFAEENVRQGLRREIFRFDLCSSGWSDITSEMSFDEQKKIYQASTVFTPQWKTVPEKALIGNFRAVKGLRNDACLIPPAFGAAGDVYYQYDPDAEYFREKKLNSAFGIGRRTGYEATWSDNALFLYGGRNAVGGPVCEFWKIHEPDTYLVLKRILFSLSKHGWQI
jgi:hypothetical protein